MTSSLVSRGTALRCAAVAIAAFAFFGVFLAVSPRADAAITSVFSNTATPIPCVTQGSGVRLCDQTTFVPTKPRSTIKTFDTVPIDVRVAFPPAPASGPDGPYPLAMIFHGYAGSKLPLSTMQPLLDHGYATFSMTTRGFGESCGTSASRSADSAGCANGYVRLLDTRYEVRDAQELAGLLADEGHTSPTQIGAIGGSYGGGLSMSLAALKNRKMLPNGTLVPWTSPLGTPMQIAGAAPEIPWTDLPYALVPNGRTLDYVSDAPYLGRTGVLKQSWETGLYLSGLNFFYAPAGSDPDADLQNWNTLLNAGEPYDDASGNPMPAVADVRDELTTHHSSYYIDHSQPPAPLLISSGWTDDLFPVDEALRYYNRTRTEFPTADISLFFGSFGHQRGQNKAADLAVRSTDELDWLDYYVKGVGSVPFHGVKAFTETCPNAAASAGPFTAPDWAHLSRGEVRFSSAAPKTILPTAGSGAIGNTFDPLTGGGACATTSAADQADTATYRMAAVPAGGFTLMGSPTVIADITSSSQNSQIAARLLDVDTGGNQTLIARGLWRPAISASPVHQVFQLHPNGYNFAAGHIVKLELLPKDSPYGRTSNGQANVTIENLDLRLPVLESPGALGGLVQDPLPKFVPAGYQLARDFQPSTYVRPKGASPFRASLVPAFQACAAPNRTHGAPLAFSSCNPPAQASPNLTVGTPDANMQPANSVGYVLMKVKNGVSSTPTIDEADVQLTVSLSDVRQAAGLADYTGELQETTSLRITDKLNGSGADEGATVQDIPYPVTVPCTGTAGSAGSNCSLTTTLDTLVPNTVKESQRSVWQLGQIQVNDGGSDGVAATPGNSLFAVQGIFIP
jgi:predicted acyl esterase